MKILIMYFSQSGNTMRVAETMADTFNLKNHQVTCKAYNDITSDEIEACDLLGIGTPVFESHAPTFVIDYLQNLPSLKNHRVFLFATCGGTPGRTLYDLTRILRAKGGDVTGGVIIRGEVHHPAPCLAGRAKGRPNENDFQRARDFAASIADHVANDIAGPIPSCRPGILEPRWGFYDLVSLVTRSDALIRFLLPTPKVDTGACVRCKGCVKECPMDNISMRPFPVVGNNCIRCYRCETACKEKALSSDWRLGNLVVFSLYNNAFARWFGEH